ncbi:MAG TPA: efflux RND transporter periplasmic adaptor subunit [Candidatus Tectomicrobia bacterium]|nr:efflux RND transporter periplasmic adaptor subunit [Candidatus Tectomicrobia bacterium]
MAKERTKLRGRKIFFQVVALCLLAGLSAVAVAYFNGSPETVQYKTARVVQGHIAVVVSATGTLTPVTTVEVGSQLTGKIQSLFADFNSTVQQGQVIAQLNPATFEAQVAEATAQLESARATVESSRAALESAKASWKSSRANVINAQANVEKTRIALMESDRAFERAAELASRNLIARGEMETTRASRESAVALLRSARAQYEAAGADAEAKESEVRASEAQLRSAEARVRQALATLELANANLGYTTIIAPISGIVVSRNVDVGQTVSASLRAPTLFTIAEDLSKVQAIAKVDEADIGKVRQGQKAVFTVEAYPDRRFKGILSQVRLNPITVEQVVTYDVVIDVPNPDLTLRPGMTAAISIIVKRKENALLVPHAALRVRLPAEGETKERPARGASASPPSNDPKSRPGQSEEGRETPRSGVWLLSPDGRPERVWVKLGLSDEKFAEVLSGEVREGQEVIVGVASEARAASTRRSSPLMPVKLSFK